MSTEITQNSKNIFSGYAIKYPEFEVLTPQRKQSFTVRSMTISEEENLKGSVLTPITVSEHLAQVLWNCIIKKPDDIKTYDDFIAKVTLRDRDCLVYGLFVATYKETQSFSFDCSACGKRQRVKINMEKGFNFKIWDKDEDCLDAREVIPLQILSGANCVIKAPVIKNEIDVAAESSKVPQDEASIMTDLLMVDYFEFPKEVTEKTEDGKSVTKVVMEQIKDRKKILEIFKQIPAYDRKVITQQYAEKFDQYRIGVKAINKCFCGNEQEVKIDVTRQFFLALY